MKLKVEFEPLQIKFELTPQQIEKVALREISNQIALNQASREGAKAPDGTPYPAYSRKYEKFRVENRRSVSPNLVFSGDMKKTYKARRIPYGADGYMDGEHKGGISNAELETVNAERGRTFTGFGPKDPDRINQAFADEVEKQLKKAFAK